MIAASEEEHRLVKTCVTRHVLGPTVSRCRHKGQGFPKAILCESVTVLGLFAHSAAVKIATDLVALVSDEEAQNECGCLQAVKLSGRPVSLLAFSFARSEITYLQLRR